MTQWSVGIEATGDRVMNREEIVELADGVAEHGGIASGIGEPCYGATILITADSREEAKAQATEHFRSAVAKAGLPDWPVSRVEAQSEYEEQEVEDYF